MFDLLRRWPIRLGWYFDKEGGAAGAGQEKDDQTTDDSAGGGDAEKAGKQKVTPGTFTPEQQAAVDLLIGEARKKEREHFKAELEKESAKAKKKAEEETLKDKEEWKTLAEKRQSENDELTKEKAELEPFKDQAEKYQKALNDILDKQKKSLPKFVLPLIEKMDPVEAMAYITEHADELGAKPSTYSETPEGREKKVTDEDKKEAQKASGTLITRTF